MTPEEFIKKWQAVELKESSAAQSHFIDLCHMLGELTPTDADPTGEWYCFEMGATKTTGGEGWADVWKKGFFGWEYKGKRKDLNAAFAQLQQYALALENPPLLIVCDMDRFRIHTNWTNSVSQVHEFTLADLKDPAVRQKLKWVFSDPDKLRPTKTRQKLTEQAAAEFAELAKRLRSRGLPSEDVAHFINRLVFCMFAEDVDLLPKKLFSRLLQSVSSNPEQFAPRASDLFKAMRLGGEAGWEKVDWFNGGLFNDDTAMPLERDDLKLVMRVAELDWAEIDPSILGTLFERGLDPDKRSQLGAHYTDRDKIMMIVEPVIVRPWLAEWEKAKGDIEAALEKKKTAKSPGAKTKAHGQADSLYKAFLDRLRKFTVLDPACGSGNFLYLALLALKDLEHRVGIEAEALGFHRELHFHIGPEAVRGIEINVYAAELARVSVWIGEIQWMRRNGFDVSKNPILKPLTNIECRDAVLNQDGSEAQWPEADVIIGNPPFLGGKLMRTLLGSAYVEQLFKAYSGRVAPEADLICYWFVKAWERVLKGHHKRVGLVATNSIRGGSNRRILDEVTARGVIFNAWQDEAWVINGAAVRVSLVCFAAKEDALERVLDGHPVARINPDLSSESTDLTKALRMQENQAVAFMGDTKGGAFEVISDTARTWLQLPLNPNGRPNSDVLKPWFNGSDVVRRSSGKWIVDFGWQMDEAEASLYAAPFEYCLRNVKPIRSKNRSENHRNFWWRHVRPRPGMWAALTQLSRFIVTPTVAKHRIFVWLPAGTCPDHQLIAIARDDDTSFGILHSRFHEAWTLRLCTWLGVGNDPRYTPSTTFETFPFPVGLSPDLPAASYATDPLAIRIGQAAKRLNELREAWLNPADLIQKVPEVVPGYPDRILPIDDAAAVVLKKRTLTNLYNERPTWLQKAHEDLDAAVAAAYGWPENITDDEALEKLLALNHERAGVALTPQEEAEEEPEEA